MDRSRLEAFSDGVFAVAITLLALDLTVAGPAGHGSLTDQLHEKWPAFLAYLISFFMIGIIWVNHHVLVRSIINTRAHAQLRRSGRLNGRPAGG